MASTSNIQYTPSSSRTDEAAEVKPQEQLEEKMETKSEDVAATIIHLEG